MKKDFSEKQEFIAEKAVRAAAITTAAGVLACGVCCVLPIAIPAIALASAGGAIAWIGGEQRWAAAIAGLVVTTAWGWIGLQSLKARAKPSRRTLYMMVVATVVLVLGLLWPRIEPLILTALKA